MGRSDATLFRGRWNRRRRRFLRRVRRVRRGRLLPIVARFGVLFRAAIVVRRGVRGVLRRRLLLVAGRRLFLVAGRRLFFFPPVPVARRDPPRAPRAVVPAPVRVEPPPVLVLVLLGPARDGAVFARFVQAPDPHLRPLALLVSVREEHEPEPVVRGREVVRQALEPARLAEAKRTHEPLHDLRLAHLPAVVQVVHRHAPRRLFVLAGERGRRGTVRRGGGHRGSVGPRTSPPPRRRRRRRSPPPPTCRRRRRLRRRRLAGTTLRRRLGRRVESLLSDHRPRGTVVLRSDRRSSLGDHRHANRRERRVHRRKRRLELGGLRERFGNASGTFGLGLVRRRAKLERRRPLRPLGGAPRFGSPGRRRRRRALRRGERGGEHCAALERRRERRRVLERAVGSFSGVGLVPARARRRGHHGLPPRLEEGRERLRRRRPHPDAGAVRDEPPERPRGPYPRGRRRAGNRARGGG